jgi:SAM-dependent methyltransferase
MKKLLHILHSLLLVFGLDLGRTACCIWNLPGYLADHRTLKKQQAQSREDFPFGLPCPCLADRRVESGSAKGHYFHQDLLVARRIFLGKPATHVDVGSRIDGFVAHIASFRPIRVIDIRPLSGRIPNIEFVQADLMRPLRKDLVGFCDSLSCLHTLEHFGLGRYGDPINFEGHLVGLNNLIQMLQPGGRLYLSVPIGPQRIEFNAHRVFSVSHLLELFQPRFRVDQFSYVDDDGNLHEDVGIERDSVGCNYGCIYGCGIFEMAKL